MQLVKPHQRLELRATLTLMKTSSPAWSITGQDHSIWRKTPPGERHLQQLSFSLMLTLGNREAAWPVLPCRLHSPDPCKILTCSFGQRQALFCFPSVLSYNTTDHSTQSLLTSPTLSSAQVQEGKLESAILPSIGLSNAMQKDSAHSEGITDPLLLLLSAPSPSLFTARLYPKTSY